MSSIYLYSDMAITITVLARFSNFVFLKGLFQTSYVQRHQLTSFSANTFLSSSFL